MLMPTEIESRYIVPDQALFNRLRALERWDSLTSERRRTLRIVDHYLDTPGRALLRQEWALRLRAQDGVWLLTLKGPRQGTGPILERAEYETELPDRLEDPAQWPPGVIRSRVAELTGGMPLQCLLSIKQRRYRQALYSDERLVGEVSLDVVRTASGSMRQRSFMLECELCESGCRDDLEQLDAILQRDFGLWPESRSKLRRALDWVEGGGSPDAPAERALPPIAVRTLAWRYGVALAHAEWVAALAMSLCQGLAPWHSLPPERWHLVEAAALLHDVGGAAAKSQRHLVSRDILLRQPIEGLTVDDRLTLAAAAYLPSDPVSPERAAEVLPAALSPDLRLQALTVAALVRLADALDTPPRQRIDLRSIDAGNGPRITLNGEKTARAARGAERASDLWQQVSQQPLVWQTPKAERQRLLIKTPMGLKADDSMAQAATKVLRYHFQAMLDHERGTREGQDIEALHAMRVATRRMRSALRLFGPFLQTPYLDHCNAGLKRAGRALGKVRDMDVASTRAHAYLTTLPAEQQGDLDDLLADWDARRTAGRRLLLRYLDSQSYQVLLANMRRLIESLEALAEQDHSPSVQEVAPRLLYLDWSIVRAFGHVLPHAPIELLHALRIACKRLRYALEFFAEVLPYRLLSAIPEVITLQDHLGDMRDWAVAAEMSGEFLAHHPESPSRAGAQAYRDLCQNEMVALRESFPAAWKRFAQVKLAGHLDAMMPAAKQ
jgi:CHAD domain-containing protein